MDSQRNYKINPAGAQAGLTARARGTLPAQGLSYWLQSQWRSCDGSVGHLMTGWRWGTTKRPAIRYPRKVPQALPAAAGGEEVACAGASSIEHSAGARGFRKQSAIQDKAGLWDWTSCYLAPLSLHWKWERGGQDSYLKMCRRQHLWPICYSGRGGGVEPNWKFTIYSVLFRSKIFMLFYNLSQLKHIPKFFRAQTMMISRFRFSSSMLPEVSTYIGRYKMKGTHNF